MVHRLRIFTPSRPRPHNDNIRRTPRQGGLLQRQRYEMAALVRVLCHVEASQTSVALRCASRVRELCAVRCCASLLDTGLL